MRTTGEFLLTFLLNACWQIVLIVGVTAVGDLFLRRTLARYRHWLWVAALGLSFLLPFVTSGRLVLTNSLSNTTGEVFGSATVQLRDVPPSNEEPLANASSSAFQISGRVAFGVLAMYLLLLCYRGVRLFRAWVRTQAAKRGASLVVPAHRIHATVAACREAIGFDKARTMTSGSVNSPATVGIFRPLIILPDALARDASDEELTAAIGHELMHVRRRDYLLNLIYEFVFLPLSFHPAAALVRRRITQTRELRCDELVTELLLRPEVYARSLVQLARSAMPLANRARTVAVGIADADILEVRVMSLLQRTKLSAGKKKFWLIPAALLLAIPCAAAAAFTLHLNIDPAREQEPSREAQEKNELRVRREQEIKEKMLRQEQELKEAIEKETDAEVIAKLKKRLLQLREDNTKKVEFAVSEDGETHALYIIDEARAREERERESKHQAVLTQLARISMDQAIQIATSQNPGKVFECSLVGERWQDPGELAKPSLVLYHVVILSGDESKPIRTHVLVNAVDGTIFRTSQEKRRESNNQEK
jgi:beta-lactamase regulating signal transducer with metallopeptidase domain/uncharacterized membrane protein YkoI